MKIQEWKEVKLSEIADIFDNIRVPLSSEMRNDRKGIYPYCGANGIVDYIDDWKFEGEYVLIAEDGGNFHDFKTRPITYLMTGRFWVNNHAHVLKAKNGINKFLHYSLQHKDITKYIIGSTRTKLNKSALESIKLVLPPLPEQQKIAEILSTVDDKIEVIDQQITETQALKKGLMQRLLTKGIGHTEFKDSPLGMIPKSWEVVKLDDIAKRGSGHTPNKQMPEYYNGGVKWVSLGDSKRLDNRWIEHTKIEISKEGIKNSSAVLHPKGTVLLSRDAGVGKSAVMKTEMGVSQHFITWNCKELLNNWFLYYTLQEMKPTFERVAIGSTIKTIGLGFFKKMTLALPSKKEQDKIADILNSVDDKLEVLSEKKNHYQELKQGLMQQLLTGKIRVTI